MPRKCGLCRGVVSHQGDETMYFDYFVHDNSSLYRGGIKSHMINFVHISLFCHIFIMIKWADMTTNYHMTLNETFSYVVSLF